MGPGPWRLRPGWPSPLPDPTPERRPCHPPFAWGLGAGRPPPHPNEHRAGRRARPAPGTQRSPSAAAAPTEPAHLAVDVLLEVQLLLQGLQPVFSVHTPQHLVLQLLLGLAQRRLELGERGQRSGRRAVEHQSRKEAECLSGTPLHVCRHRSGGRRASAVTEVTVSRHPQKPLRTGTRIPPGHSSGSALKGGVQSTEEHGARNRSVPRGVGGTAMARARKRACAKAWGCEGLSGAGRGWRWEARRAMAQPGLGSQPAGLSRLSGTLLWQGLGGDRAHGGSWAADAGCAHALIGGAAPASFLDSVPSLGWEMGGSTDGGGF